MEGEIKMKPIKVDEITKAVRGDLIQGDRELIIERLATDSREVKDGDLFLPLTGENHDAHKFIPEAVKNGATALIVDKKIQGINEIDSGLTVIKVRNTNQALQDLAYYYRKSFKNLKVIGITGSAGKTTTKDMVATVLQEQFKVLKTEGNLNNYFGLPLTLLKLTGEEDIAVLEMGMSDLGEIRLLTEIAAPQVGVITNVGTTHLESLGTVENVARGKFELIAGLPEEGIAILNYDNKFVRQMGENFHGQKVIYYGMTRDADLYAERVESIKGDPGISFKVYYQGEEEVINVSKPGKHNIYNALATIAVARELNISWDNIRRGLMNLELSELRMDIKELNDTVIINDTYNANPISMKAGLEVLNDIAQKRKIAVLGAMLELGPREEEEHLLLGKYLVKKGINILITVGKIGQLIAKGAREEGMETGTIFSVENNREAGQTLQEIIKPGDTILIKGSRGNRMEEIVDYVVGLGG